MTIKQELSLKTLALCQKEGMVYGIDWLLDNIDCYYKNEVERLERKLAVRDRLLFKQSEDYDESRRIEE